MKLSRWAHWLFPTDLASFLDFIRQHGDAAYSLMFGYAASHSLLLALFAGYSAHSGALSFGTLIMVCWFGSFAGDVTRYERHGVIEGYLRGKIRAPLPTVSRFRSARRPT
jgi:hypothetical protein